ncbi:MAG: hypothetical protein SAK29_35995, partial [Scytonema sp. PMC 1069.18]|nr:hypothetical protein [Scytonema sp. PMC 1069.18]
MLTLNHSCQSYRVFVIVSEETDIITLGKYHYRCTFQVLSLTNYITNYRLKKRGLTIFNIL